MSEVETFTLLDRGAHPTRKLCIVHLHRAHIQAAFVTHKLFKVVKVDFFNCLIEVSDDVFWHNKAVLIGIKVQKGSSHRSPCILKPFFQHFLQVLKSSHDGFSIYCRYRIVLKIRITIIIFNDIEMRKELLLKILKIKTASMC